MVKIFVGHGMVVEKIHEIVSFKPINWLEKNTNFKTHKRNKAENEFERDFEKLLSNAVYGKTMEIVRNCLGLEFFEEGGSKNIFN